MIRRTFMLGFPLALMLALPLPATPATMDGPTPAPSASPTAAPAGRDHAGGVFEGSDFVQVLNVQLVASQDNAGSGLAQGGSTYVIAHVRFINNTGLDLRPQIDHFVLTSTNDGARYYGLDTGSTVLIGISNYRGLVKMGASQEYTVGFRASAIVVGGTINYEITQ